MTNEHINALRDAAATIKQRLRLTEYALATALDLVEQAYSAVDRQAPNAFDLVKQADEALQLAFALVSRGARTGDES